MGFIEKFVERIKKFFFPSDGSVYAEEAEMSLSDAILYYAGIAAIANLLGIFLVFPWVIGIVAAIIGLLIGAVIQMLLVKFIAGKNVGFEKMTKLLALVGTPSILGIIPAIGGLIGGILALINNYRMLKDYLKLNQTQAILVIVIPIVIGLIIGFIIGLMGAAMTMGGGAQMAMAQSGFPYK